MSKKCTSLWRETHVEVKTAKIDGPTALLEVEMSKKCAPLWGESRFEVKMLKKTTCPDHFEGSDAVLRGGRKRFCTLPKGNK